MGIATVAVYAEGDAGAPFVTEADRAVALPGRTAAETYLNIDALLAAAAPPGLTPSIPATASCPSGRSSPGRSSRPG